MKTVKTIVCVGIVLSLITVCVSVETSAGYSSHGPIRIDSNSDFDLSHGVTGGDGTSANPYIIEGYKISGQGIGYCIYIGNTTDHFEVRNCHLHNASGNSGTCFWNSGLIFNNVKNGKVVDTVSRDNNGHAGFMLKNSDDCVVEHNFCTGNVRGLYLYFSDDNDVCYNNFSSNSFAGAYLSYSDDNEIRNSILSYNDYHGIWLVSSDDNEIGHNHLNSNSQRGLYLFGLADSNVVRNNTIGSNGYGGYLHSATGYNDIYHNNFDNNNQAVDYGSTNDWDDGYPSGGNYWSDYNGNDDYSGPGQDQSGSDGIGDTAYNVDCNTKDNYPLMSSASTIGLGKQDDPNILGKQDDPN
jgi:parallel beta-helix repeat protein